MYSAEIVGGRKNAPDGYGALTKLPLKSSFLGGSLHICYAIPVKRNRKEEGNSGQARRDQLSFHICVSLWLEMES